ncbi:unnamed protein product [Allacma fusca]|uniref:Uncharacterized protein n=1 Tax=Allacma fusca TaxID=39272 RepID=A0A8J2PGE0_9HEXA|nr:unnamed protein product [Allacma fusca]
MCPQRVLKCQENNPMMTLSSPPMSHWSRPDHNIMVLLQVTLPGCQYSQTKMTCHEAGEREALWKEIMAQETENAWLDAYKDGEKKYGRQMQTRNLTIAKFLGLGPLGVSIDIYSEIGPSIGIYTVVSTKEHYYIYIHSVEAVFPAHIRYEILPRPNNTVTTKLATKKAEDDEQEKN